MKHRPELIGVRIPGTNRLRLLTRQEQMTPANPKETPNADKTEETTDNLKDAQ